MSSSSPACCVVLLNYGQTTFFFRGSFSKGYFQLLWADAEDKLAQGWVQGRTETCCLVVSAGRCLLTIPVYLSVPDLLLHTDFSI